MKYFCILISILFFCANTQAQKTDFDPDKEFSVEDLLQDLELIYTSLDEGHPGIYSYTPKDSLVMAYQKAKASIKAPMTEREFRLACEPLVDLVRCGHTDVFPPTELIKYRKKTPAKDTPFQCVILNGKLYLSHVVKKDTLLARYQEIQSIDGRPAQDIIKRLMLASTSDGYNNTHKLNVANRAFPVYYRYIYGERDSFKLVLLDSLGKEFAETISRDTTKAKKKLAPAAKVSKKERFRKLTYPNEVSHSALLEIEAFQLRKHKKFYKKTFKELKEKGVKHLIIDLRNNGGGSIVQATNLLKYLLKQPAGFSFAHKPGKRTYKKHLKGKFPVGITKFAFSFFPNKKVNGMKVATPKSRKYKKKYRFDGDIYVLTNGGTFSASVMVSSHLKDQKRATFIGSETGGGQNGSNAVITPYLVPPNTKIRLRLPVWHITHLISLPDIGGGVLPDYPIEYSIDDVKNKNDKAKKKAFELIGADGGKG